MASSISDKVHSSAQKATMAAFDKAKKVRADVKSGVRSAHSDIKNEVLGDAQVQSALGKSRAQRGQKIEDSQKSLATLQDRKAFGISKAEHEDIMVDRTSNGAKSQFGSKDLRSAAKLYDKAIASYGLSPADAKAISADKVLHLAGGIFTALQKNNRNLTEDETAIGTRLLHMKLNAFIDGRINKSGGNVASLSEQQLRARQQIVANFVERLYITADKLDYNAKHADIKQQKNNYLQQKGIAHDFAVDKKRSLERGTAVVGRKVKITGKQAANKLNSASGWVFSKATSTVAAAAMLAGAPFMLAAGGALSIYVGIKTTFKSAMAVFSGISAGIAANRQSKASSTQGTSKQARTSGEMHSEAPSSPMSGATRIAGSPADVIAAEMRSLVSNNNSSFTFRDSASSKRASSDDAPSASELSSMSRRSSVASNASAASTESNSSFFSTSSGTSETEAAPETSGSKRS